MPAVINTYTCTNYTGYNNEIGPVWKAGNAEKFYQVYHVHIELSGIDTCTCTCEKKRSGALCM